jgi:hypothetical protein
MVAVQGPSGPPLNIHTYIHIVTTSNSSAIANSHALEFTIARLCLQWLSPGNTPNTVNPSASMRPGSCPRASISQDSPLLRDGLRLRHLHQERMAQPRANPDCLPTSSNPNRLDSTRSDLALFRFSRHSLCTQPQWTPHSILPLSLRAYLLLRWRYIHCVVT